MAELKIDITKAVEEIIEKLKAEGYTAVKHGRWDGYICSECNVCADYFISGDFYFDEKPTFCPNCGARMDLDVLKIICQQKSTDVQPVNQWISVDERLPQDGEEALVYAGNRGVMIGLYDSVLQVWLDYECCGLKVTHWQPLPEPPKEE